jgi:hypothetical protein
LWGEWFDAWVRFFLDECCCKYRKHAGRCRVTKVGGRVAISEIPEMPAYCAERAGFYWVVVGGKYLA